MPNDLSVLVNNRESLLLAEAAAWLHDGKKCSDEAIKKQSKEDIGEGLSVDALLAHVKSSLAVAFGAEKIDFDRLIREGSRRLRPGASWLVRVLRRCHHAAHIDKEEDKRLDDNKQHHDDTRLSSPFGYEESPLTGLTKHLDCLPYTDILNRAVFRLAVEKAFSNAPGDTRRPDNEVTLWDWSSVVAALYSAALAGELLKNSTSDPQDLRWRLLSVRFDGSSFTDRVVQIPDLLVRRKLLDNGLDRVQTLLEKTYPLGTEVYRDENGSVFVVPDLAELLDLKDKSGPPLCTCILDEFGKGTIGKNGRKDVALQLKGEILPRVVLDPRAWSGSPELKDVGKLPDDIPPIAEHLAALVSSHADPSWVDAQWSNAATDICPVCGLRPQALKGKAKDRKLCDICEQRREDRSKEWIEHLDTSIWIDEVADKNGRIALLVGQFGLDNWLKPEGLVQTLFVVPPSPGDIGTLKNSSFARLRRIWETTRQFWLDINQNLPASITEANSRLHIHGVFEPTPGSKEQLGVSHAYEINLGIAGLSVVYTKEGEFLTADNLLRVATLINAPEEQQKDYATAVTYIQERLQNGALPVEEPSGYGQQHNIRGTFQITTVERESTGYTPAIPLVAEPRTFMALVPASHALIVTEAVIQKYEKEMGKVRNRLPLTLGVAYSSSRTPLNALLDAGRRMLEQPVDEEQWTLHSDVQRCGHDCLLTFTNGITWKVPITMGDGVTEDNWYPYFFIAGTPRGRVRVFRTQNGRWVIHVAELKKGDVVYVTPSRFDFEFLDVAARRFEVSYTNGKRRGKTQRTRPYYLEELGDLRELWRILSRDLATSQVKNIEGLIEAKRTEWAMEPHHEGFATFVADVLANAQWSNGQPAEFWRLQKAALSGQLGDSLELHMEILKQKPKSEEEEQ